MTLALASLFRKLFSALVVLQALAVFGLAALTYANTASAVLGVAVLLAGFVLLIASFGVVALMIENNLLLHRIATATESGARANHDPKRPDAPILSATRGLTAHRAGPTDRIEPVVSLARPRS